MKKIETIQYKAGTALLDIDIYIPEQPNGRGIMFFFGGAWQNGSHKQFERQAKALADIGYTVFAPDYRVAERFPVTPFDCVADAASVWALINSRSGDYGIESGKISAGGGSAGAHLALMAAIKTGQKPEAFILFNPCVDMSLPEIKAVIGDAGLLISPSHLIDKKYPPMLIFHGEADEIIPLSCILSFCKKMRQYGTEVEIYTYPEKKHGFFNYDVDKICFEDTLAKTIQFLEKIPE